MNDWRFACQPGCTDCCRRKGFVYLTERDLDVAAAFLGVSRRAFEKQYVYRTRHLLRLRKPRSAECPFLKEDGCALHPAKPTQCRLYPFWPELAGSRRQWRRAARECPGIGRGPRIPAGTVLRLLEEMREAYPP
ncbi:MAG: YkgJ family cysteine cluster protein [Bryobacterales bacterium]|jgi:hypothetical protein|nr:YkgJ family cysteine cluster protein [Bryobacterales bacterium]